MHAAIENPASPTRPPEGLEWYADVLNEVNAAITAHLDAVESAIGTHSRLGKAVRYLMALPGKRFRPVLVLECCRTCGGRQEQALPAAIAVECVHTFSLIHDDLPAMDDDDVRRARPGQPQGVRRGYGTAGRRLAGDARLRLLVTHSAPQTRAALVRALSEGVLGMIEGQAPTWTARSARPTSGSWSTSTCERRRA